ncbi:MAG: DUF2231 domain-containing protein [Tatlockia sp.]|nr:DUF2231 domain-containing protein [Tatlockia sp.]
MNNLIIPNWHPLFVHFTVALFSTGVLFSLLSYLFLHFKFITLMRAQEFEITGRWCLWFAALITILTVAAGFHAYYTVSHDAISHAAMTIHRNWALATASAILLVAGLMVWRYRKKKKLTLGCIIGLLLVQGLLVITAWHGAELVFRYGMGVMSLPQTEENKHHP